MGVSDRLARLAVRHAHVLVVEAPGRWRVRSAVERAALDRGWRLAESPADADVLAVCGVPGPLTAEAVGLVWEQMPGPRVRVDVPRPGTAPAALDDAAERLLDSAHHVQDARTRPAAADLLAESDDEHGEMDHGEMDQGEHGDMDHGDMDHGDMDHGDMDHGDMEMSPGGVPLAGGGEDRDGLEMDLLHVRLGPVLPLWPSGLVLRCALQGDVITEATAQLLDMAPDDRGDADSDGADVDDDVLHAARRCDNTATLLALAGWEGAAAQARLVRDGLLAGDRAGAQARLARLQARVRRSYSLRRSLRGVRPLSEDQTARHGLPLRLEGDTYDRLLAMLDRGGSALREDRPERHRDRADEAPVPLPAIAALVAGLDLATARLVVAGLDLDPVPVAAEAAHG